LDVPDEMDGEALGMFSVDEFVASTTLLPC
jgi:hypothetical protein